MTSLQWVAIVFVGWLVIPGIVLCLLFWRFNRKYP